MAFNIPAPAGDQPQNRFTFDLGSETLSLPKLEYVPYEADEFLNKLRGEAGTVTQRNFILQFIDACDSKVGAKLRKTRPSRDQVEALYEAWANASEVTPGKSSDSSTS